MAQNRKKRLGERLVEEGLITREQLEEALKIQARTGELLGQVLVRMGAISEEDLNRVLGISSSATKELQVSPELLKLVPEDLARSRKVFPLKKEGNRLFLLMANPLDITTIDDLRLWTGLEIEPVKAEEREIRALINRHYGLPEVERALEELGVSAEETEIEEALVDRAPIVQLVNSLISGAVDEQASDIHVEPFENEVRVRYRVDGILHEVMRLPRRMAPALVARIKIMANMDIAERRLPQDGRILTRVGGKELDLRVSTFPTIFGEKVVIRLLDKEQLKSFTLENLGFSPQNLATFKNFLHSSYGMVLLTGPTGSGKTTTLYAALAYLNSVEKNIVTVEDPVEYVLEGINQAQVNVKAGATFATYLRSILRQDPDIIMVGEIRDLETAEIAVQAATTGHLVLSTLHTNDAPGALTRLLDMGVEPFMVASSVLGVVAQRLVRTICPRCREPHEPSEPELAFLGKERLNGPIYRGRGCDYCRHTGYRGRVAVHEVLRVSPRLQRLVLNKASTEELRRAALQEGMISLKEDAVSKVLQGITSVAEVMRVLYQEGG
ncbi:general secretory pathway protein E [Ammonifex degensii KC4]|uniref:protein-secreting ATPase n=1 Tax=Ammonifex degensii (strain DSM 10501 / KC4) TaxID=429009 RepID=C9R938_AMMDK|nr:type II secretion system ATPase GspE [Ammonifex degensii]ACX52817.1 general secretory pathway protein E [Ammonifex degensii KC4]